MFKTKKFPSKKAFTIVELVIVIAVIAILMGIMFIGGTAINNNAKQSTLDSDLRNFEIAMKSAVNDPDNNEFVTVNDTGIANANVEKWMKVYFEDDMALVSSGLAAPTLGADHRGTASRSSAVAATKMKDPYGMYYQFCVLDNSSELHTDLAFTVISYGKNKQTATNADQNDELGDKLDKDDVMLVVRVVDSVIYTGTFECAEKATGATTDYYAAVKAAAPCGISGLD